MNVNLSATAFVSPNRADPAFAQSIMDGLAAPQKRIDSKWLYDVRGSHLFDAITELDEYYPTRTELGILRKHVSRLQEFVRGDTALVELGSGSSTKTRILLDALNGLKRYVPIDISQDYLHAVAYDLATEYEDLDVHPAVADFTDEIVLPSPLADASKILFFPGSTIGNFETEDAAKMLARLRRMPGVTAFVIGVDLVKDTQTLIRAYDDLEGVTAAFNLNLLTRINRELGADFDVDEFQHEARWNENKSRIEMHLISVKAQVVNILGQTIQFSAGETIHTENSHKYTPNQLKGIAKKAGWLTDQMWTDSDNKFGVAVLTPDRG